MDLGQGDAMQSITEGIQGFFFPIEMYSSCQFSIYVIYSSLCHELQPFLMLIHLGLLLPLRYLTSFWVQAQCPMVCTLSSPPNSIGETWATFSCLWFAAFINSPVLLHLSVEVGNLSIDLLPEPTQLLLRLSSGNIWLYFCLCSTNHPLVTLPCLGQGGGS